MNKTQAELFIYALGSERERRDKQLIDHYPSQVSV
jgi:hypothetical protein